MLGATTSDRSHASQIVHVQVQEDSLVAYLADGRAIATPIAWYPRLLDATPEQRMVFEISAGGFGIYWPELDEDLSVEGMLRGTRAPRVQPDAVPTPEGDPATDYVRLEARKWVHSFARTRPGDRFPSQVFSEFVATLLAKLAVPVTPSLYQAAHVEALDAWTKMHPPNG